MNRRNFLSKGLKGTAVYALLPATLLGSHAAMARGGRNSHSKEKTTAETTEDEVYWLMYMREEEKLARDVYLTMNEEHGHHVFANIADSEEIHTLAVKRKIEKFGLEDPVEDDDVGVFVNKDLKKLYKSLINEGKKSLEQALWVACAIEEIDMMDLQEGIDTAEHPDIARVYQNLMNGSKNHLRAFVSVMETKGIEYETLYMDPAEADEILNG